MQRSCNYRTPTLSKTRPMFQGCAVNTVGVSRTELSKSTALQQKSMGSVPTPTEQGDNKACLGQGGERYSPTTPTTVPKSASRFSFLRTSQSLPQSWETVMSKNVLGNPFGKLSGRTPAPSSLSGWGVVRVPDQGCCHGPVPPLPSGG